MTALDHAKTTLTEIQQIDRYVELRAKLAAGKITQAAFDKTHAAKAERNALATIADLQPAPVPVPTERWDLMDPRDRMELTAKEGGLLPVRASDGAWVFKLDPPADPSDPDYETKRKWVRISRGHWPVEVNPGEEFCFQAHVMWPAGFYGTIMRLESYNDALADLHRLELDRFKDDGKWHVVRNRLRPPAGVQPEHFSLSKPLTLPSMCVVELSGRLGGAMPKTMLKVDGEVVFEQIALSNWSVGEPPALRARIGYVAGDQAEAGEVRVWDARFRKGPA